MKKFLSVITVLILSSSLLFAISYKNNTYQKLAEEYTKKAQKAMDAGEYLLAVEYAEKAGENAELSEAFIKKMSAKSEADNSLALARNRMEYVKSIRGDINFPLAFADAQNYYTQATESYRMEEYDLAKNAATTVLTVLADVKEITPLPKYYIVTPWAESKDCFWNISGRPYVYNNPLLWENLYQANKESLPEPNNPNLIEPGMKMEIPSISGEYRDGVYSPEIKYDVFSME